MSPSNLAIHLFRSLVIQFPCKLQEVRIVSLSRSRKFVTPLFRILGSFGVFISAKCCGSFNKLNIYFLRQPLFSYMDFLHTETVLSSLTHSLIPKLRPEKSLSSCLSRQITQLRDWSKSNQNCCIIEKRYWEQEESQIHGQRVFLFKTTPLKDIN